MRRMPALRGAIGALVLAWSPAAPQDPADAPAPAAPADVATTDAILGALYDVISGGPGVERDWDRFRSLFLPEGRLVPAARATAGRDTGCGAWRITSVS
ncbi:MAG: hypothetical protein ACE5HP_11875 [Gemmatimonadota bacterium]